MSDKDKRNEQLMKAIRAVHSMIENDDIEKHRQSQDHIGKLLGMEKQVVYESVTVGEIPGEWVRPSHRHTDRHVILYCHGGGYFTGSLQYARILTAKLAVNTGMDVFSFNYRLAPEHPWPAALIDGEAVWDYLMYQGFGSRDILLAGDSAGGNLALTLTLKLKEEGRRLPLGLVLMSPWTDLTLSGKSHQSKADMDPVLNRPYLDKAVAYYAEGQDLQNPLISPLFGDFSGFPPVYIQCGTNEVLLDDSVNLCRKLCGSGVLCRLDRYTGMWHVFQMSPFKKAYDAMEQIGDFIFSLCR